MMSKNLIVVLVVAVLGGSGVAYKVYQDHAQAALQAEAHARAEEQAEKDKKNREDAIKRLNRREDTSFTVDWSKKAK